MPVLKISPKSVNNAPMLKCQCYLKTHMYVCMFEITYLFPQVISYVGMNFHMHSYVCIMFAGCLSYHVSCLFLCQLVSFQWTYSYLYIQYICVCV